MAPLIVLIVDDAPLLRQRLKERLERIDGAMIIGQAEDVQGGIDAFRTLTPDAVILDIQMPGGTGIDVLEKIKRERPGTVVIMLTNYPMPQLMKKSHQAGADYFFDKCSEFESAIRVIRELTIRREPA